MSALITALNRVLVQRLEISGKITRIEGDRYYVALSKGVSVCSNATATAFNIGDVVRVSDKTITGGVINEGSLPVFQV
jgi:hypothetical protein